MKSERRHELQRNELADWLAQAAERVKPYRNVALTIVALAALLLLVITTWSHRVNSQRASTWDSVFLALGSNEVQQLDDLATQNPSEEVGQWAAVAAGDLHLQNGCNELFTNKANAIQELRKAEENYLRVLEQATDSTLRQRATFGLARTYEALSGTRQAQGQLGKAVEQYNKLVKQWPGGPFTEIAQNRLKDLETTSTKEFYDQFAAHEPKPPASTGLGTGNLPFDAGSLGPGQQPPDFSKVLGTPDKPASEPGQSEAKPPETPPADTNDPKANEPEATQSGSTDSQAQQPESKPLEITLPQARQPEAKQPEAGQPAAKQPQTPAADAEPQPQTNQDKQPAPEKK